MKRPRQYTELEKRERALISHMRDWPLEPGQMLLLGPVSVAKLTGAAQFDGHLPDAIVLDRPEWDLTKRPGRATKGARQPRT